MDQHVKWFEYGRGQALDSVWKEKLILPMVITKQAKVYRADADTGSVQIKIEAANTPESRIIIADTGCGMTPSEFENRWMIIGTGNKLASPYTPKGRQKAGKKGIGRFSVERLAEKVRIYSYTDSDACKVSINWNLYEEISTSGLKQRIKILRSKEDADAARYISNQIEYYLSLNLEGNSEKEQMYVREQIGDIINNYELAYESSFLEVLENQCLPVIKKQEKVELKLEDVDNLLEEIVDREKEESYWILKELYQSGPELKQMPYTGTVIREESRKRQSELERAKAERKKYQKKAAEHRKEQESRYKNSLELIQTGASYDSIKLSLDHWREEEQFQKETKKQYEKTEEAYQSYLEYQETELSMYKNLATLGILAGNFGHETQDIISRINNTLAFYSELAPYINNPYFGEITENIVSDFSRISGYSSMIVEFLRKRKRTPKKNLEFGEVLDVVSALYVGMLEAFHIHFTWESEDSICLTMRQIDLESVIINMITNAFEQVKTKREREIFIKFEQRDNDIYLYFEDSGNGVPEDQREDIFRAFRTSKEDGIGLGLNIVKDIVTSYGGAIFVTESEKLGGAKFVVHFVKKEGSS